MRSHGLSFKLFSAFAHFPSDRLFLGSLGCFSGRSTHRKKEKETRARANAICSRYGRRWNVTAPHTPTHQRKRIFFKLLSLGCRCECSKTAREVQLPRTCLKKECSNMDSTIDFSQNHYRLLVPSRRGVFSERSYGAVGHFSPV